MFVCVYAYILENTILFGKSLYINISRSRNNNHKYTDKTVHNS